SSCCHRGSPLPSPASSCSGSSPTMALDSRRACAPSPWSADRSTVSATAALFGVVVEHAEMLVNPAVYADLVPLARENRRNDLGIQRGANRRDEKRRRHVLFIEQTQNA